MSGSYRVESSVGLRTEGVLRRYLEDLRDAIGNIDVAELEAFTSSVVSALARGSSVFIAGNGGSACASLHMASDWAWATSTFSARPRVRALVDNIARLTALANDVSYEQALALQLDCAQPSDLLVIVSVSGESPNLVQAAEEARRRKMQVVSALGRRGKCAELSDHTLVLGGGDYGLAEDLHVALSHMVVRLLSQGERRVWASPDAVPDSRRRQAAGG